MVTVFLTGTTDLSRQFHSFCLSVCTNEDNEYFKIIYNPTILMADTAASITIATIVYY